MGVKSIKTQINGKVVKEPKGWESNSILATYGTGSNQPQIETDRFEFVLDAAAEIIKHKDKGRIFEPLPCTQTYTLGDNNYMALDGYLDLSSGYEELNPTFGSVERPNNVMVSFKQDKSIAQFLDRINGVSFGSLLEEGIINHTDYTTINTAIVKRANPLDVALTLLSIFMIQKQIQDAIRSLKNTAKEVASIITGGITGNIAAAVYIVATLVIEIAYAVALVALLVGFVKQIIDLLLPPVVKNKGIKFRTLLEASCRKFGYKFESNILELSQYHYLPSKKLDLDRSEFNAVIDSLIPKHPEGKVGIPNVEDYGYLINEFWDMMADMFNTKVTVYNDTVYMYNADDPFWFTQSEFIPHETINFPSKKYNAEDLKQTRMMSFATDIKDEWTTENYVGTSYEIKTSTANGADATIKGLEKINIPLALASSKTKATPLEKLVITLASACDSLSLALGQKTNLAKQIKNTRVNIIKVSDNFHSIPKVVLMEAGKGVPKDHRDKLSAKYLMEKFHYGKSFVGDALGQKVIYEGVTIPFNLDDLQKTLKSGLFTLPDGRTAEFLEISYNFAQNTAECTIQVQEVYAKNLKETTFEP